MTLDGWGGGVRFGLVGGRVVVREGEKERSGEGEEVWEGRRGETGPQTHKRESENESGRVEFSFRTLSASASEEKRNGMSSVTLITPHAHHSTTSTVLTTTLLHIFNSSHAFLEHTTTPPTIHLTETHEQTIRYILNAEVDINTENVIDLLWDADYLELQSLSTKCIQFVVDNPKLLPHVVKEVHQKIVDQILYKLPIPLLFYVSPHLRRPVHLAWKRHTQKILQQWPSTLLEYEENWPNKKARLDANLHQRVALEAWIQQRQPTSIAKLLPVAIADEDISWLYNACDLLTEACVKGQPQSTLNEQKYLQLLCASMKSLQTLAFSNVGLNTDLVSPTLEWMSKKGRAAAATSGTPGLHIELRQCKDLSLEFMNKSNTLPSIRRSEESKPTNEALWHQLALRLVACTGASTFLRVLLKLPQLVTSLTLADLDLPLQPFAALASMKSLDEIRLINLPTITATDVSKLPSCRTLYLHLPHLTIDRTRCTEAFTAFATHISLIGITYLPKTLTSVSVRDCGLSAASLDALIKSLPQLKTLDLSGNMSSHLEVPKHVISFSMSQYTADTALPLHLAHLRLTHSRCPSEWPPNLSSLELINCDSLPPPRSFSGIGRIVLMECGFDEEEILAILSSVDPECDITVSDMFLSDKVKRKGRDMVEARFKRGEVIYLRLI